MFFRGWFFNFYRFVKDEGLLLSCQKKTTRQTFSNSLRPISLLYNTDYKIATKATAKRLEAILPHVINSDQTGYIKGRYIGENVRLISDIISYTATKNLLGLAVFLDFEKAFDSIKRNFLLKVLEKLNFGPAFSKIGIEILALAIKQNSQ